MMNFFSRYIKVFATAIVLVSILVLIGCAETTKQPTTQSAEPAKPAREVTPIPAASDDVFDGNHVEKSDDEWREMLPAEAFHVLREEGTERAYSGELNTNKEEGIYRCGACGLKLFDSKTKYESGTGWPSFYQPINAKNIVEKVDKAFGAVRTEIECARCGSHIGHVFDDGPKPTGLRYCMNSVALKFEASN